MACVVESSHLLIKPKLSTSNLKPSLVEDFHSSSNIKFLSIKKYFKNEFLSQLKNEKSENIEKEIGISKRGVILSTVATITGINHIPSEALAVSARRAARDKQVPESEYTTLPNGLKIYDVKIGTGPEASKGSRVAIHYIAKWKGLTFQTSRQGAGVTGGSPYGFDVGNSDIGLVLKGLDLGVEGMRVGGERLLIIPPELAYGNKGVQEIPPNATLEFNVELLSIKQDAFGSRVKLVEG